MTPDTSYSTSHVRAVGMCPDRLTRINPAMHRFVEKQQAPGFVSAVARQGQLVHFESTGFMDVAGQVPMPLDAIFRLHSQTKPVIGAAVMMLFEQGLFGLNDNLAEYLPEFSDMEVLNADGSREKANPITIKHLMTHTAGLTYYLYPEHPVGKLYAEAGLMTNIARLDGTTCEDYVKTIASLPLMAQPGTVWQYSEAMCVLGRLIEVVSGQSLGEYLQQHMFAPLGMVDTGFYVPEDKHHRLVTQYYPNTGDGLIEVPPEDLENKIPSPAHDYSRPPSYESGSSGLVSTASDYLRFAQMLANGGELEGERLLSPASVNAMMTNALGPEFGDQPLKGVGVYAPSLKGIGFGYCGFVVTDVAQTGWIGSNGEYSWGGSASTDFWIDRKEQIVGLVMTQLVPTGCIPSRERFHQLVYQAVTEKHGDL